MNPNDGSDVDFSIDENEDGRADIWDNCKADLTEGNMNIDAWRNAVTTDTDLLLFSDTYLNEAQQSTVDLSALSGDVTYEFVVHFGSDRSNSLALLGHRTGALNTLWSIRFEQYSSNGRLGFTGYGRGDYTFDAVSGQSINSPYGDSVHLVYVNRGGTTEAYVNGVLVGTKNESLLINHAQTPLGINEGSVNAGDGIYGFAAYNLALSQGHHVEISSGTQYLG